MLASIIPQIVSAILALAAIRIYSELLTSFQMGEAMLGLGGMALLDAIFSSSVNQTIFYYASKPNYANKIYNILLIFKKIILKMFIAILIFFSCMYIILFYTNNFYLWILYLFLLTIYFLIEPIRSSFFALLNVTSTRKVYGLQIVLDSFSTLIIVSIALLYQPSWISLLMGILFSRVISMFTNAYLVSLSKNLHPDKRFKNTFILHNKKEVFMHIKPIMLMGILGWISSFADRYIVAGTMGIIGSGYYSVASGLTGRPYNVTSAALTAHFRPSFYTAISNNEPKNFRNVQQSWAYSAFLIGLLGIFLFYVLNHYIVTLLLAPKFQGHVGSLLWIFAATLTTTILTHVYDNKFLAYGLGNKLFKLQLILLPLPLVLIAIGATWWGVFGAAFGKLFAESIKLTFIFYHSRKL